VQVKRKRPWAWLLLAAVFLSCWGLVSLTRTHREPTSPEARAEHEARVAQARADTEERDRQRQEERAAAAEARRKRQEEEGRVGTEGEAVLAAQEAVKKKLQFPAEASFSRLEPRRPELREDGSWAVWGTVTAKNAFGVKTHYQYKAVLRKVARDGEDVSWAQVECTLTPGGG
jgi:hypothetical protein